MLQFRLILRTFDLSLLYNVHAPYHLIIKQQAGIGTIHKLRRQERGRGLAKCLCYYISLCSKLAYGGGGGSKIGKILPTQFMDGPLLEVSSSYGSAVSQTYINVTRNAIRSFFGSGLFLKIPTFKFYSSKLKISCKI